MSRKFDHVTPLLSELNWLRFPESIDFKLAVLIFVSSASKVWQHRIWPANFVVWLKWSRQWLCSAIIPRVLWATIVVALSQSRLRIYRTLQGPDNYVVQNASFCLSKINNFVQNAVFCPHFSRLAATFQKRNIALISIYSCVMLI